MNYKGVCAICKEKVKVGDKVSLWDDIDALYCQSCMTRSPDLRGFEACYELLDDGKMLYNGEPCDDTWEAVNDESEPK